MQCTLCSAPQTEEFYRDEKRQWLYFRCPVCDFVFRDPATYLTPSLEEARYKTHNNSIENQGYVKFLSPVVEKALQYISPEDIGLDYGSGPGPILDILFSRRDIKLHNYDPFFAPNPEALSKNWDFITCTEVFEHFYQPGIEFDRLSGILKPGGYLFIMSEWRKDLNHFKNWGYRMDNTHVCFLNEKSHDYLCDHWGFECKSSDGRLSVLQKKS